MAAPLFRQDKQVSNRAGGLRLVEQIAIATSWQGVISGALGRLQQRSVSAGMHDRRR
jgi:hypothetical protein